MIWQAIYFYVTNIFVKIIIFLHLYIDDSRLQLKCTRSIFYINFQIYDNYVNICFFLTIIIYQHNIFLREIIYFSQDQRGLWKKSFFFFSESERITLIIAWCKSRVRNFSSTESATSTACNIPQIRDTSSRILVKFPRLPIFIDNRRSQHRFRKCWFKKKVDDYI